MFNEQRFGIRAFGGFKKKDVVEYIDDLVKTHEEEIKKLKQSNEDYNKELKIRLEEEIAISNEYKEKIANLEKIIESYDEKLNNVFYEKEDYLKSQDDYVKELEKKVKDLEKIIATSKNLNIEENVKKAESIAKEKVKVIVKEGREKIFKEYEEQLKKLEEEKQNLKEEAIKEASQILNNAAQRVQKFNDEIKRHSLKLLEAAELVSNEILRESFKIAFRQSHFSNYDSLLKKFDIKILNETANEEVLAAIERLKSLNFLNEKLELQTKDLGIKRRRRFNFNEFKREEERK